MKITETQLRKLIKEEVSINHIEADIQALANIAYSMKKQIVDEDITGVLETAEYLRNTFIPTFINMLKKAIITS